MDEKFENAVKTKEVRQQGTAGDAHHITPGDNQGLVNTQAKDNANLSPMELHDHITPAVAEAFHKDPVKAMLDIYHKGLQVPNETPDQASERQQREAGCKARLEMLQKQDPKLFGDITRIGEQIASKQLSPEQAGQEIAAAARAAIDRGRLANGGQPPELDDNFAQKLVALSSTMLAARGTFGDNHDPAKTKAMIDAAEAEFRKAGAPDVMMRDQQGKPLPAELHGVTWKNDGEPAICGWTTDGQRDRYKFEIGL